MTARLLAPVLAAAVACGCGSDIPPGRAGGIVEGTVSYSGSKHAGMSRPALRVLAFVDFPPTTPPYALATIEGPDFSRPVPFRLRNLDAHAYKVIAQIYDIDAPPSGMEMSPLPAGGWPTFCALGTPASDVIVTDAAPRTGVAFSVWDDSGLADPCSKGGDICPAAGKASLETTIAFAGPAGGAKAQDTFIMAVTTGPGTFPVALHLSAGDKVTFPLVFKDKDIAPASYLVFVCFDVDGDDYMMGCDPMQDFAATYTDGGGMLALAADTITRLAVDLDAHAAVVSSVDTPASAGCP